MTPAHLGLLGPAAESLKHDNWHILKTLNQHFNALKVSYGGDITATSGYRCPTGNSNTKPRGAKYSNHMFGKAFDYDQQDDEENWNVWKASQDTGAVEYFLYEQSGCRIRNEFIPKEAFSIPQKVIIVCNGEDYWAWGITYSYGHAAW
jgi:hypothetical protein